MWRSKRIAVLALALILALAPASPRAQTVTTDGSTVKKAIAYAGCAGSVILLPFSVAGVFAMVMACASAMAMSVEP